MAKQLDETTILNELRGESAFFQSSPTPVAQSTPHSQAIMTSDTISKEKSAHKKKAQVAKISSNKIHKPSIAPPVVRPVDQQVDRLVDPLSDQSSDGVQDQSTQHSVKQSSARVFDMTPVLPKPKAFYITERQDEELNVLVKRLSDRLKGIVGQKIDRSVVTRLILEDNDLTSDEVVERLAALMINRLTDQLAGRQGVESQF